MGRFLSPKAVERAFKLAESSYRPLAIIKLKEEIEGETRAAEVSASASGIIDMKRVQKIVNMKLQLDCLYADWVEGNIS